MRNWLFRVLRFQYDPWTGDPIETGLAIDVDLADLVYRVEPVETPFMRSVRGNG